LVVEVEVLVIKVAVVMLPMVQVEVVLRGEK
jgi:hypothetical protein